MKRYDPDPSNFFILNSFDEFRRSSTISDDPDAHFKFVESLESSLNEHLNNPARLHGLRCESMFAHVIAAMDECSLITTEDSGPFFANDETLRRPDLRVITKKGEHLLIEVKNYFPKNREKPYRVRSSYLSTLRRYADLNDCPVKLAVYWSHWKLWTLTDLQYFEVIGDRLELKFSQAFKFNEMYRLGDSWIRSKPPLTLRLYANPQMPRKVVYGGKTEFYVHDVCLCSAGEVIRDELETKIAWFLLRNGNWQNFSISFDVTDDLINYADYCFSPTEPNPDEPFQNIGFLSELLSNQYRRLMLHDARKPVLTPGIHPSEMGVVIPRDYNGKTLSLQRFIVYPFGTQFHTGAD